MTPVTLPASHPAVAPIEVRKGSYRYLDVAARRHEMRADLEERVPTTTYAEFVRAMLSDATHRAGVAALAVDITVADRLGELVNELARGGGGTDEGDDEGDGFLHVVRNTTTGLLRVERRGTTTTGLLRVVRDCTTGLLYIQREAGEGDEGDGNDGDDDIGDDDDSDDDDDDDNDDSESSYEEIEEEVEIEVEVPIIDLTESTESDVFDSDSTASTEYSGTYSDEFPDDSSSLSSLTDASSTDIRRIPVERPPIRYGMQFD